jgi:hypothetical protein
VLVTTKYIDEISLVEYFGSPLKATYPMNMCMGLFREINERRYYSIPPLRGFLFPKFAPQDYVEAIEKKLFGGNVTARYDEIEHFRNWLRESIVVVQETSNFKAAEEGIIYLPLAPVMYTGSDYDFGSGRVLYHILNNQNKEMIKTQFIQDDDKDIFVSIVKIFANMKEFGSKTMQSTAGTRSIPPTWLFNCRYADIINEDVYSLLNYQLPKETKLKYLSYLLMFHYNLLLSRRCHKACPKEGCKNFKEGSNHCMVPLFVDFGDDKKSPGYALGVKSYSQYKEHFIEWGRRLVQANIENYKENHGEVTVAAVKRQLAVFKRSYAQLRFAANEEERLREAVVTCLAKHDTYAIDKLWGKTIQQQWGRLGFLRPSGRNTRGNRRLYFDNINQLLLETLSLVTIAVDDEGKMENRMPLERFIELWFERYGLGVYAYHEKVTMAFAEFGVPGVGRPETMLNKKLLTQRLQAIGVLREISDATVEVVQKY